VWGRLVVVRLWKVDSAGSVYNYFKRFIDSLIVLCAARKETAREKQLKEEEKILESVAEKTGKLHNASLRNLFDLLQQQSS